MGGGRDLYDVKMFHNPEICRNPADSKHPKLMWSQLKDFCPL